MNHDQQAIRRLKQGNIRGLESLVKRYQTEATRVAYLITHDAALAEDVMQAAFLQVYDRIDQFDETRPFAPWFFRIVANAALKAMRHPHLSLDQEVPFAEIIPAALPGPEESATDAEMQAAVWSALGGLSPDQRAVVVMRYYLGYSETEMAEHLDRPLGTVRSRVHAAHQKLRQMLTGLWYGMMEYPAAPSDPQEARLNGVNSHE